MNSAVIETTRRWCLIARLIVVHRGFWFSDTVPSVVSIAQPHLTAWIDASEWKYLGTIKMLDLSLKLLLPGDISVIELETAACGEAQPHSLWSPIVEHVASKLPLNG